MMNSSLNLVFNFPLHFPIQYRTAASPSSWGMFVYRLVTSNVNNVAPCSTFSGKWCKKSMSSLTKLGTSGHSGFSIISKTCDNLCVGLLGPPTIGRNFKSCGWNTSIYSEFCSLIASAIMVLLCIFGSP